MAQNIKIVGPSSDGTTLENSGSLKQVDVKVDDSGGLNNHVTEFDPLLAGEIEPLSENGWQHSYGSSKRLHEPDMTTADYDPYGDNTEYIVGIIYAGSGGIIIGTHFDGNTQSVTVRDAAVYGLQPIPCFWKMLYAQGTAVVTPRGSPTETV